MVSTRVCRPLIPALLLFCHSVSAQTSTKPKIGITTTYTGIEVGAKGVKMSVIEKGPSGTGSFNIIKDSSVNTDFISFSDQTFAATLNGLCGLYASAEKDFQVPSKRIFTVVSSGVKMQAEKENKIAWINKLIDSFRVKINEPERKVEVVDVTKEAILSHLGIVPAARRFNTFLIDIGSGNTKGGFFPYGTTDNFRLFQLNWGTKSVVNATEKRCEGDVTIENYNRQLYKVLAGAENSDIVYAVNASGSYPLSDNIAVSGGIAWAVATLIHPEAIKNSIVPVTYSEVARFCEKLYNNPEALNPEMLSVNINYADLKEMVMKESARVHKVFDQHALMGGSGLLLKIMRQFAGPEDNKQFYLIKNGQVGWVSAYVNESTSE